MSRFCKFGKLHVTKGNVDKLLGILEKGAVDYCVLSISLKPGSKNTASATMIKKRTGYDTKAAR